MSDVTNKSLTLRDLPEYVATNAEELIAKSVFSAVSTKLFKVQTGVKATTAINVLDTSVTFGDGTVCGFSNTVNSVIAQRNITPGFIKVNAEYCHKDFYNTFASHATNVAAGRETLPFEEYLVNDIIKHIGEALETAIWQGDTNSATANLNKFDGLMKIMLADAPAANKINLPASGKMVDRVWSVYNAIPEGSVNDAVIYMNTANFRSLVKELVDANLFHYTTEADAKMDIILPGTFTHVIGVPGLNGKDIVIGANPKHIVYGTDMESDAETFKLWFSDDNDTFRLKVEFVAGVQIVDPSEVILSFDTTAGSSSL